MIEVLIKNTNGSTKPYQVDENSTVQDLKEEIQRQDGYDAAKQVLTFGGRRLKGLWLSSLQSNIH